MAERNAQCPRCGSGNVAVNGSDGYCWGCKQVFTILPQGPSDERAEAPLRIFLSYGHTEAEIVRRIKERLEARGHDVWFDQSDIKAGDDWRAKIAKGVASSNGVIACLSRHAYRDGGVCRDEINIAIGVRGGDIKTVALDPRVDIKAPPTLRHRQWLDMSSWQERMREGDEAFETWFEGRMAELMPLVESEESTRFQDDIDTIRSKLGVEPDDSRRMYLLGKPFYGRKWLTERVVEWLDSRETPRVCLVTGDAGVGKSAFAANLAHWRWDIFGRIAASVFCRVGQSSYNDPGYVVKTLALLLARGVPQYRVLLRQVLELAGDVGTLDERSLFNRIVLGPLTRSIDGNHESMLVVVDGLDEAGGPGENTLAEVLAAYALELPAWMKILVTSRRVWDATAPFGDAVERIDLSGTAVENMTDVRAYLEGRLSERFGEDPDYAAAVEAIAEGSGGIMLYAELMADAVEKTSLTLGDITEKCPQGLHGLFRSWFRWTFPDLGEYRETYRDALGCLAAAPGGALPVEELRVLFGWNRNDINDFRRRLEVFLLDTTDLFGSPALALSHAFISQWLMGEDAGEFRCEAEDALDLMGRRYFEIARDDPEGLSVYESVHVLGILDDARLHDEADALWKDGQTIERCLDIVDGLYPERRPSIALGIVESLKARSDAHAECAPSLRASVLHALGSLLSSTGSFGEAETALWKAFEFYRDLVETEPETHLSSFFHTTIVLAHLLERTGRTEDAVGVLREEIEILHRIAKHALEFENMIHYEIAGTVESFREATELRRKFADLGANKTEIVDIINAIGVFLSHVNREETADEVLRSAIASRRELAEAESETHLPRTDYAISLLAFTFEELALALLRAGRAEEAEGVLRKALGINRILALVWPETYLHNVSESLRVLGRILDATGHAEEADGAFREALGIHRKLAEAELQAHLPDIAIVLDNYALTLDGLAQLLERTGRTDEAEGAFRDTIKIRRELTEAEFQAYNLDIAESTDSLAYFLNDLALFLLRTGRAEKAEEACRAALGIFRSLALVYPEAYLPSVANSLSDLGIILDINGLTEEAEAAYREALEIRRKLAEAEPGAHLPDVANSLSDLGNLLGRTGQTENAEKAYREALEIRRKLAEAESGAHLPDVANSLEGLGMLFKYTGRAQAAESFVILPTR